MTIQVANALCRYFEGLYCLNQNLIKLYGYDILRNWEQIEDTIDQIVLCIPRIVPYKYNQPKNQYQICSTDGLMEFADSIPFIENSYNEIFKKHYSFLTKIIKIRNKLEHQIHGATIRSGCSNNNSYLAVSYDVLGKSIELTSSEIVFFVKDLNLMFAQIQDLVVEFALKENKSDYPYYQRLVRFEFSEFNKIYESDLLRLFSKTLLPF